MLLAKIFNCAKTFSLIVKCSLSNYDRRDRYKYNLSVALTSTQTWVPLFITKFAVYSVAYSLYGFIPSVNL